jgi:predicted amidohydrolase
VITLAEQAANEGARLVVFPEAFVPGYPDWVWRSRPWDASSTGLYRRLLDQAVVAGSPATELLAKPARRLGIWRPGIWRPAVIEIATGGTDGYRSTEELAGQQPG